VRPRRAGVRRRAALDQGNNKGPPSPGPMTVPVVRSKGPSESTAWKGRHGRHDEGLKHDLRDGLASCHLRVQSWCRGLADVDPGQSRAASRLRPRRTPNEFARPCGQGSPVDPGGLRSRGTLASRGPQVGPGNAGQGSQVDPGAAKATEDPGTEKSHAPLEEGSHEYAGSQASWPLSAAWRFEPCRHSLAGHILAGLELSTRMVSTSSACVKGTGGLMPVRPSCPCP